MNDPSSDIAGSPDHYRPLRSQWRNALLFLLDTTPAWLGRMWLWAVILVLVAWALDPLCSPMQEEVGFTSATYVLWPDGTWHLNEYTGGYQAAVRLNARIEHSRGRGWQRWAVADWPAEQTFPAPSPPVGIGPASPSPSYTAVVDTPKRRHRAYATIAEDAARSENDSRYRGFINQQNSAETGGEMLRDGVPVKIEGLWAWRAYRACHWAQRLFLGASVLAIFFGALRLLQRAEYRRRLTRLDASHCGLCNYDLKGSPAPVCPECGASIRATKAECRRGLGLAHN